MAHFAADNFDNFTGLLTRHEFLKRVDVLLTSRNPFPSRLMMISLDLDGSRIA